jgi:hypothetical protein
MQTEADDWKREIAEKVPEAFARLRARTVLGKLLIEP